MVPPDYEVREGKIFWKKLEAGKLIDLKSSEQRKKYK
jgi:hypothetical protein